MAKQISDDEQNLRRKARRRLIGAFALTLAVVVILPMVLDSEPKSTGQDIELSIPSADEVGAFVPKVPVSGVAVPVAASSVVPADTEAVGKEQPSASTQAISKPADKPASAVTDGFVAQVGAYSNAATAKQELGKLKKWGFKAYSEKAGGMIRVRVGPYVDREKAEKARSQLEKHGLHPVVMSVKGS